MDARDKKKTFWYILLKKNVLEYIINIIMEINFSSKVYSKSLLKGS